MKLHCSVKWFCNWSLPRYWCVGCLSRNISRSSLCWALCLPSQAITGLGMVALTSHLSLKYWDDEAGIEYWEKLSSNTKRCIIQRWKRKKVKLRSWPYSYCDGVRWDQPTLVQGYRITGMVLDQARDFWESWDYHCWTQWYQRLVFLDLVLYIKTSKHLLLTFTPLCFLVFPPAPW